MYTYFSYFYTSYTLESLKCLAFSIRTILLVDYHPPSPIIGISDFFQRIHQIEIGISCVVQQPNHLTTGGARRRWVHSCVSSSGSSLSFTSWSTLEATGFHVATHTHTHGTVSWPPGFYSTHTHTHTTHCDARTHTHTITSTHTHTHTQGQEHAHKHIQTHANTRTQKKTHTLATLPVDKSRHARQLVGHW